VLCQSFQDIEIIVLDNGSTDGTRAVLAEYLAAHPDKLRLDLHENIVVANNRNLGMRLAIGKYIMCIDADDYVEPDYCESYFRAIEEGGYDVVCGGYVRVNSKGRIIKRTAPRETPWAKYLLVTPWAKIHRTEFVRKHGIEFADMYGEDMVFCLKSIFNTERIKIIKYMGYNWFFNEKSITNTIYKGFNKDVRVIPMLERMLTLGSDREGYLNYFLVRSCIYYLLASGRSGAKEDFLFVYKTLFGWLEETLPASLHDKYLYRGPKGEYFKTNVIILIFTLIRKLRLMGVFAGIYCKNEKP
jgi:glycosyltransferase involved in cell wall biosynthesis